MKRYSVSDCKTVLPGSLFWYRSDGKNHLIHPLGNVFIIAEIVNIARRQMFTLYDEFSIALWGWVTHICVRRITTIDSDNGLSPARSQAIILTNTEILLTWPLGTNFNEKFNRNPYIFIQENAFEKVKKCRIICPGLNVLTFVQSPFCLITMNVFPWIITHKH